MKNLDLFSLICAWGFVSVSPHFNSPANIQPNSTEGFKSQGRLLSSHSFYENGQPEEESEVKVLR